MTTSSQWCVSMRFYFAARWKSVRKSATTLGIAIRKQCVKSKRQHNTSVTSTNNNSPFGGNQANRRGGYQVKYLPSIYKAGTTHSYDIEVSYDTFITVHANSRTQAAAIARKAGYEVRSVNMVG